MVAANQTPEHAKQQNTHQGPTQGGMDQAQGIGREVFWKVPRESIPQRLEKIFRCYHTRRENGESFVDFTRRHDVKTLQEIFG